MLPGAKRLVAHGYSKPALLPVGPLRADGWVIVFQQLFCVHAEEVASSQRPSRSVPVRTELLCARRSGCRPCSRRRRLHARLANLDGVSWIVAMPLYRSGLRLMECSRSRVKDIDFTRNEILVRQGKGDKDRSTPSGRLGRLRGDSQRSTLHMQVQEGREVRDSKQWCCNQECVAEVLRSRSAKEALSAWIGGSVRRPKCSYAARGRET